MSYIDKREPYINEHSAYSEFQRIDRDAISKKNFAFGILVIIQQIIVCFIYGFLLQEPLRNVTGPDQRQINAFTVNFSPVFKAFSIYMFVLVGFGLLFSYNKRLVLSGLGFTLLITVLSVEWFFMFNAFWNKANIKSGLNFSYQNRFYNIYLANQDGTEALAPGQAGYFDKYEASLIQAVKCGLANSIAFSAILGRAGLIQAFLIALVGSIGYTLDFEVVRAVGLDYGYTYRVFIFGGFMALIIGLLRRTKENTDLTNTQRHLRYTSSLYSGGMALIGTVFIWVFFPLIVSDAPTRDLVPAGHALYRAPINILYGLAGSTIMAMAFSYFFYGKLMLRDLTHGSIAGAIAVASASYYITNPVWALLVGSVAGIVQAIGNNFQKKHSQNNKIITTISFCLFGLQGIIGAAWSAIWRAVVINRNDGLPYDLTNLPYPALEFASGCIAIGIGIGFGLIAGILVLITASHERADHFDDYTYWVKDDGISSGQPIIVQPPVIPAPMPVMSVKESRVNVKQKNSYL